MPEAAEAAPLLRGIPDEIVVWEVLVRLPPKALLRCRAVCPAWRRATSTRRFLLAHHSRQPTLPLLCGYNPLADADDVSVDIILLDNRRGLAADDKLQSVARLGPVDPLFRVEASCDGLLVLSINRTGLCICNPATRQYAPLPLVYSINLAGMYLHATTGEYRLLLTTLHSAQDGYHVFTLGSGHPPRHIGCPHPQGPTVGTDSVLLHGCLHWCMAQKIMVFNTITESFRQMPSPVVFCRVDLFQMDGMLSVCRFHDILFKDVAAKIDIWVLEDYQSEVWHLKHRVELPVAQLKVQFGDFNRRWNVVLHYSDGDVLLLVRFGDDWLLQLDINGKLVASFHSKALCPTQHRIKQTLVPHTFFQTLEGYSVNTPPFI